MLHNAHVLKYWTRWAFLAGYTGLFTAEKVYRDQAEDEEENQKKSS